ncbi:hypothetical protein [Paludibacterium denitrificans]|uniref:Uncharacterized protein n=1 Tax=Paludibacterium denitrificans TaxID=2675226 RepID=A0A844GEA5_9NEIS|nr:hypothetical protein [Paludibacterium denitrificans]MTD33601.1 hypothetical protein [Paludibacterium denitrificans]
MAQKAMEKKLANVGQAATGARRESFARKLLQEKLRVPVVIFNHCFAAGEAGLVFDLPTQQGYELSAVFKLDGAVSERYNDPTGMHTRVQQADRLFHERLQVCADAGPSINARYVKESAVQTLAASTGCVIER